MQKLIQRIVPFLVLAVVLLNTYALFFKAPYLGFYYSYEDEISVVFTETDMLRVGDRLLRVGGVDLALRKSDFTTPVFDPVSPGSVLDLTISRDGQVFDVRWIVPVDQAEEITSRLYSTWWLPFIFWAAGTLTWYLMRPRGATWRLLVAFNMLIALYLSALNGPALNNLYWSVPFTCLLGCLSLPVFLHLHWSFPTPFRPLPGRLAAAFYAIALLAGILSAFQFLPAGVPLTFAVLAVIGSLLILAAKLIFQPQARRNTAFIFLMFLAVFVPSLSVTIAYSYLGVFLDHFAFSGVYYNLPALPSAYFLVLLQMHATAVKHELQRVRRLYGLLVFLNTLLIVVILVNISIGGDDLDSRVPLFLLGIISVFSFFIALVPLLDGLRLSEHLNSSNYTLAPDVQLRANRLLTPYFYLAGLGLFILAASVSFQGLFGVRSNTIQSAIISGLIVSIVTLLVYPYFQREVEKRLFGISRLPGELVEAYTRQIPTTLNLQDLAELLTDQVLPDLLIRQSALVFANEAGREGVLYAQGLEEGAVPRLAELRERIPADQTSGLLLHSPRALGIPDDWVRVVFPLRASGRLLGLWLLGARDPDDEYTLDDLYVLQILAGQTAIALANILQTIQLHSLYQSDMDRIEAERIEIARELHDQVINQVVSLAMRISEEQPRNELLDACQQLTDNLRAAVLRLRPANLDYGLGFALHDLAHQLQEANPRARVEVDLPHQSPRYEPAVEKHIYRIAQHVCENTVRHSGADRLALNGRFAEREIDLCIEDNGKGFTYDGLNLSRLIAERHFGLVGIHERAELIGARLFIDTAAGRGTSVRLRWEQPGDA